MNTYKQYYDYYERFKTNDEHEKNECIKDGETIVACFCPLEEYE